MTDLHFDRSLVNTPMTQFFSQRWAKNLEKCIPILEMHWLNYWDDTWKLDWFDSAHQ
jgi:hypothetical protein